MSDVHLAQRAAAITGSAIFLVIAPGTLAMYIPWYLTHWHFAPPLFPIARVLGAALIVAGLPTCSIRSLASRCRASAHRRP
jgi:hypothetical protein